MGQESSKAFPFQSDEEVEFQEPWKMHIGRDTRNQQPVSIFSFDKKQYAHRLSAAQNAVQKLRTMRHPHILKFLEALEVEDKIYLATELVRPLELPARPDQKFRDQQANLGLYQIISAVSFLNNTCNLSHGSVTPKSIFVTKAGDWKLGGFELAAVQGSYPEALKNNIDLVPAAYRSPEVGKKDWIALDKAPAWANDSWQLACLTYACINGGFTQAAQLGRPDNIPASLLSLYKRQLASNPAKRLNPEKLLESSFFESDLVKTVTFLEEITIKDKDEKEKFFTRFANRVDDFPIALSKYKILPQLTNSLVYGTGMGSFSPILNAVFKIGQSLNEQEYVVTIVPCVIKLFESDQRMVRVLLLQNFAQFSAKIPKDQAATAIWPKLLTGFSDQHATLRELTVKYFLVDEIRSSFFLTLVDISSVDLITYSTE
eukprot:g52425.t1